MRRQAWIVVVWLLGCCGCTPMAAIQARVTAAFDSKLRQGPVQWKWSTLCMYSAQCFSAIAETSQGEKVRVQYQFPDRSTPILIDYTTSGHECSVTATYDRDGHQTDIRADNRERTASPLRRYETVSTQVVDAVLAATR